jgi:hypothetical protein
MRGLGSGGAGKVTDGADGEAAREDGATDAVGVLTFSFRALVLKIETNIHTK